MSAYPFSVVANPLDASRPALNRSRAGGSRAVVTGDTRHLCHGIPVGTEVEMVGVSAAHNIDPMVRIPGTHVHQYVGWADLTDVPAEVAA